MTMPSFSQIALHDGYLCRVSLKEAGGICECCRQAAPFNGADGIPYLEVHHVQKLAEKGADTTTNAVAICPNCHRELHYGECAKKLVEELYDNHFSHRSSSKSRRRNKPVSSTERSGSPDSSIGRTTSDSRPGIALDQRAISSAPAKCASFRAEG
ncbi:MAG: HNH endonuclease [Betaproteobacteria bacterium]|nr:HNH endonuclease [Betaproteobacteria bacterium]MBK8916742.1 HNH endonuclease [Betaproteobacteria bacterium]